MWLVNWLPTGETTAKGSPRGAQSREMGPSPGGPGEKSEKPGRKPITVGDKQTTDLSIENRGGTRDEQVSEDGSARVRPKEALLEWKLED